MVRLLLIVTNLRCMDKWWLQICECVKALSHWTCQAQVGVSTAIYLYTWPQGKSTMQCSERRVPEGWRLMPKIILNQALVSALYSDVRPCQKQVEWTDPFMLLKETCYLKNLKCFVLSQMLWGQNKQIFYLSWQERALLCSCICLY